MGRDHIKAVISLTIGVFFLIIFLTSAFTQSTEKVPLFNVPENIHFVLISAILPYIISIAFLIVFPRVFTMLYLKYKKITMKDYKNVYIKQNTEIFDMKKLLKRGLYVALLSLGIATTLLSAGIFHPSVFLTPSHYNSEVKAGHNLIYNYDVIMMSALLIYPLVIGLWSIGWTLEDAGLMHYRVPKKKSSNLFEIEPVHYRYNGFLKGYAGLSVILYLISNMYYNLTDPDIGTLFPFFLALLIIPILIFPMFLLHFIQWKLNKNFIVKKLNEIKAITEDELESFLVKKS